MNKREVASIAAAVSLLLALFYIVFSDVFTATMYAAAGAAILALLRR